ncbi:GATA type zinc finger transcription factor family protein [Perilla frutescens var. hirtella]|uniref:GATA type zinc finger transcription factor family protein n=1 Tax=Perilla frutescens var. hirtella TaxID=608512 RepID=A0AAD4IM66_PERFH|nr:GATA type zinc finger transcription factor family protein [Perilla frutescens var. hirtella]
MSTGYFGTTQKCHTCEKVVHFAEMVSADGIPYHKTCFKCDHCNGRLAISNYSTVDGKLYCKPHFEQLFRETGSFTTKKFQSSSSQTPSRVSTMFSGTRDKCAVCKKTVYPLDKVTVEGEFFHKSCFRCAHGGCNLTTSSYAALDGILYCKPHFAQLFKEKGSYSHLTKTTSLKKNSLALDLDLSQTPPPPPAAEAEAEPPAAEVADET